MTFCTLKAVRQAFPVPEKCWDHISCKFGGTDLSYSAVTSLILSHGVLHWLTKEAVSMKIISEVPPLYCRSFEIALARYV